MWKLTGLLDWLDDQVIFRCPVPANDRQSDYIKSLRPTFSIEGAEMHCVAVPVLENQHRLPPGCSPTYHRAVNSYILHEGYVKASAEPLAARVLSWERHRANNHVNPDWAWVLDRATIVAWFLITELGHSDRTALNFLKYRMFRGLFSLYPMCIEVDNWQYFPEPSQIELRAAHQRFLLFEEAIEEYLSQPHLHKVRGPRAHDPMDDPTRFSWMPPPLQVEVQMLQPTQQQFQQGFHQPPAYNVQQPPQYQQPMQQPQAYPQTPPYPQMPQFQQPVYGQPQYQQPVYPQQPIPAPQPLSVPQWDITKLNFPTVSFSGQNAKQITNEIFLLGDGRLYNQYGQPLQITFGMLAQQLNIQPTHYVDQNGNQIHYRQHQQLQNQQNAFYTQQLQQQGYQTPSLQQAGNSFGAVGDMSKIVAMMHQPQQINTQGQTNSFSRNSGLMAGQQTVKLLGRYTEERRKCDLARRYIPSELNITSSFINPFHLPGMFLYARENAWRRHYNYPPLSAGCGPQYDQQQANLINQGVAKVLAPWSNDATFLSFDNASSTTCYAMVKADIESMSPPDVIPPLTEELQAMWAAVDPKHYTVPAEVAENWYKVRKQQAAHFKLELEVPKPIRGTEALGAGSKTHQHTQSKQPAAQPQPPHQPQYQQPPQPTPKATPTTGYAKGGVVLAFGCIRTPKDYIDAANLDDIWVEEDTVVDGVKTLYPELSEDIIRYVAEFAAGCGVRDPVKVGWLAAIYVERGPAGDAFLDTLVEKINGSMELREFYLTVNRLKSQTAGIEVGVAGHVPVSTMPPPQATPSSALQATLKAMSKPIDSLETNKPQTWSTSPTVTPTANVAVTPPAAVTTGPDYSDPTVWCETLKKMSVFAHDHRRNPHVLESSIAFAKEATKASFGDAIHNALSKHMDMIDVAAHALTTMTDIPEGLPFEDIYEDGKWVQRNYPNREVGFPFWKFNVKPTVGMPNLSWNPLTHCKLHVYSGLNGSIREELVPYFVKEQGVLKMIPEMEYVRHETLNHLRVPEKERPGDRVRDAYDITINQPCDVVGVGDKPVETATGIVESGRKFAARLTASDAKERIAAIDCLSKDHGMMLVNVKRSKSAGSNAQQYFAALNVYSPQLGNIDEVMGVIANLRQATSLEDLAQRLTAAWDTLPTQYAHWLDNRLTTIVLGRLAERWGIETNNQRGERLFTCFHEDYPELVKRLTKGELIRGNLSSDTQLAVIKDLNDQGQALWRNALNVGQTRDTNALLGGVGSELDTKLVFAPFVRYVVVHTPLNLAALDYALTEAPTTLRSADAKGPLWDLACAVDQARGKDLAVSHAVIHTGDGHYIRVARTGAYEGGANLLLSLLKE